MSRFEINGLFILPSGTHLPCGLNIKDYMWWRFMPGVVINVAWPRGWVDIDWMPDGSKTSVNSSDPNDHYRPWIEQYVGQQGWDWNWGMANTDASDDRLTIKIRRKHQEHAIIAKLMWG